MNSCLFGDIALYNDIEQCFKVNHKSLRLDFIGKKGKITELMADFRNIPNEEKLSLFYSKIKSLSLKVKKSVGFTQINSNDYQELIKHIQKETWPLYPVPRHLEDSELVDIFEKVKENA